MMLFAWIAILGILAVLPLLGVVLTAILLATFFESTRTERIADRAIKVAAVVGIIDFWVVLVSLALYVPFAPTE